MKLRQEQIDFLRNKKYLKDNETIHNRVDSIVNTIKKYETSYGEEGLGERMREWINNQYIVLSTPQLANVGREKPEGSKTQALPCSCNIITVGNSIDEIYFSNHEAAMLSKLGGGVGMNYTPVLDSYTPIDEDFFSNNKLDWVEDGVRAGQKVSQSAVRRGSVVPYESIESKDFREYLKRVDKHNPDETDPLTGNNLGCIFPIGFWDRLEENEDLQDLFIEILQQKARDGNIYFLDVENCNKNYSPVYEKLNHLVDSSNICTEAITASYDDKTFACMLLSLNAKHWDIIKTTKQIIKDAFICLDIFNQIYIDLAEEIYALNKAVRSAKEKRDIGVSVLGFHDYVQAQGLAFGSLGSRFINKEIFSTIRDIGEEYTKEFGERLGSPKLCEEAGLIRRNVSLMMVAPHKSTSFIASTSEGINPYVSNYNVQKLAGIEHTFKSKHLETLLESKNKNTFEVWDSILENAGSVKHLDFLSADEKAIFKTASEISPKDIIDLAHDRQKFIDMGQSINIWGRDSYEEEDLFEIHMYAFREKNIKTLYYWFSEGHAALEVGNNESWDTCESCAD